MAKIKGNRNIVVVSGIILLFIAVSLIYFSPLLKGEQLVAHDSMTFQGMSKEITDFRNATGEDPKWTNSMFGGMPAYQIATNYNGEFLTEIPAIFKSFIPRPATLIFFAFLFFFILCLLFGISPWISMAGALMYGLATFFFVLIGAGHITKIHTLTYTALVVSGVILAYRGKPVVGSVIAAWGLSWMLSANHPQIAYYVGIMVIIIGLTYFVYAVIEKTIPSFIKASALLLVALILAVGTNFARLYTTYEYGKYTTRGKSELKGDSNKTSGLDRDYILDYSYDLGEAITAFIPRFKGGGMSENLGENSNFYQALAKVTDKSKAKQLAENAPLYWGSQPISSAPFYFGAILCFLFVLGLFVVKGKDKWWLVATVVVAFLLSLGKNMAFLSDFMIDYFPAYNKFRDVKNIIVIQQFAMALIGVLAVKEIYARSIDDKKFYKSLKWAFGITGGLALLFAIIPGFAGSFTGKTDAQYLQMGWPQSLIDALQLDRKAVLRADAFRTFIFVSLAAATLWGFWTKKIKGQYAVAIWTVLIIADLWPIDKRYLNDDNFASRRKAEVPYSPTAANEYILKDKDPDYRVLNMSVNPWSDASTSYFHKSIGGYHGAKMERYQEMIEHHLNNEMQEIGTRLRNVKTQEDFENVFKGLSALNMLNTRYVIYSPNNEPIKNPLALGNAWIVNEYKVVANANEEIDAVGKIDPAQTACIDKRYEKLLPSRQLPKDNNGSIKLTSYAPNKLKYDFNASADQLVVFSEIYYPKGWVAYVDGKKTDCFCTDYILRGMVVPSGKHEIIFEFKPQSFKTGNTVSFASSLLLILAFGGAMFFEYKKKKNA